MAPIRKGDGTSLDSQGFAQVRKGDGTVLWSAGSGIPYSGLLHNWDWSAGSTTTTFVEDKTGSIDLSNGSFSGFDTINGVQSGDFDGVDDGIYSAGSVTNLSNHALFVVLEIDTVEAEKSIVSGATDDELPARISGTTTWETFFQTDNIDGGSPDTNPHIFTGMRDGSSADIYIDGTSVASGAVGTDTWTEFAVGFRSSANSEYIDASIGQVAVYDQTDGSFSRSDVESYLADKWGIAL